jgi:HSP20 family molecular chaperone IbpA
MRDAQPTRQPSLLQPRNTQSTPTPLHSLVDEIEHVGELSVDVYETQTEIVLKALVAGVQPTNIDINLTRDMITLKGTRKIKKKKSQW